MFGWELPLLGKRFWFDAIHFVYFWFFVSLAWEDRSKKNVIKVISKRNILPMFSSKGFMVSGLIFEILIHLELIFVNGVCLKSTLLLLHVVGSFPNTIYWGGCLSTTVCSWSLCHILIAYINMGWYLGFLFFSSDPGDCFCALEIVCASTQV